MCMQYFSADELTTDVKNMQQPPISFTYLHIFFLLVLAMNTEPNKIFAEFCFSDNVGLIHASKELLSSNSITCMYLYVA